MVCSVLIVYFIIKKLVSAGQEAVKSGKTIEDIVYSDIYSFRELEFVILGFENPDWQVGEIREFYRIGEPIDDGHGAYMNSWNFAENRREYGVSVVTTAWLHSLKSVFFNTTDERIAARGVYKIRGFALPVRGGDDEILVCPMDFAKKTRIRTRAGLERAVKNCTYKCTGFMCLPVYPKEERVFGVF